MPAEIAVHGSGHEFKGSSALYNYIDADRAIAVVPALVLAGWPPLPWGHHGEAEGPKVPSL